MKLDKNLTRRKVTPNHLISLTTVRAEIGTFGFSDNMLTLGQFIRKLNGITIKVDAYKWFLF